MALALAFFNGHGTGAMVLWPLFGTVNQLLAALTLLIITIYLAKRRSPIKYTLIPMLFMGIMTGWAMVLKIMDFYSDQNYMLLGLGLMIFALEIWMIIECLILACRGRLRTG